MALTQQGVADLAAIVFTPTQNVPPRHVQWYCGLYDSLSVVRADTASVHGFDEFTGYKEEGTGSLLVRPDATGPNFTLRSFLGIHAGFSIGEAAAPLGAWDLDPVIGLAKTPAANGFEITAPGTILGAFWISDDTKGGSAGILWGGSAFVSPITVKVGDFVDVGYDKCRFQANDSIGAP